MGNDILEVAHLTKYYSRSWDVSRKKQTLAAVDDVSFDLEAGKTLGILGESGCGKTTLARCLLGLTPLDDGVIRYRGNNIDLKKENQRSAWLKKIQIIFQDAFSSFDPKRTLSFSMREALQGNGLAKKGQYDEIIREHLRLCGVTDDLLKRYPSQLSGGQCQRMSIARTLLLQPEILICDEPVSAMDLTIQMQILNLLKQLQWEKSLSYLFISHDLAVIHYMSDQVAVIYHGSIVEKGPTDPVLKHPLHPYSQMLLASIPAISPFSQKATRQVTENYSVPVLNPGCKFFSKCAYKTDLCQQEKPELKELKDHHWIACHYIH